MNAASRRTTFETVSFKLPYGWHQALTDMADLRGQTLSQVLRDCVKCYFELHRQELIRRGYIDQFGNRLKKKGR